MQLHSEDGPPPPPLLCSYHIMDENLLVIERIGVQSDLTLIDVKGTHVYRLSIRNGMGG